MKELSIEEKAKAYDEAIERAKSKLHYPDRPCFVNVTEIFPELEESEDEKIRKALFEYFTTSDNNAYYEVCGVATKKILVWLDKQREQKPAWSEGDEMFVHGLIRGLAAKRDIYGYTTFSSDCIDITETISWLKSLKERCTWKPSDEQMATLWDAFVDIRNRNDYSGAFEDSKVLESLYYDLKKLKVE